MTVVDSSFIELELNAPTDTLTAPFEPLMSDPDALPEDATPEDEHVQLFESPERPAEVVQVEESAVQKAEGPAASELELVQTPPIQSELTHAAAEQQPPSEDEVPNETTPSPASDAPYVVVVAASPISVDREVQAVPAPSANFTPLPSSSSPSKSETSSSDVPSSPPRSTPAEFAIVPIISWLQTNLTRLRTLLPTRRSSLRWRAPMCYGIAVTCYTLTWYLSRRPPVNVQLERFAM